jgi:hypothetical protein
MLVCYGVGVSFNNCRYFDEVFRESSAHSVLPSAEVNSSGGAAEKLQWDIPADLASHIEQACGKTSVAADGVLALFGLFGLFACLLERARVFGSDDGGLVVVVVAGVDVNVFVGSDGLCSEDYLSHHSHDFGPQFAVCLMKFSSVAHVVHVHFG